MTAGAYGIFMIHGCPAGACRTAHVFQTPPRPGTSARRPGPDRDPSGELGPDGDPSGGLPGARSPLSVYAIFEYRYEYTPTGKFPTAVSPARSPVVFVFIE